jgi:hypothetical protein
MRTRTTFVILILACLASTGSARTWTPPGVRLYGFVFPELLPGDYIVSLSAHHNSAESAFEASDPDGGFDVEYKRMHLRLAGVLAMTDRTSLGVNFLFYPEQTIRSREYHSAEFPYVSEEEQSAYLRPEVVLAFRPTRTLEIYGGWSREAPTTTLVYDVEPDSGDIIEVATDGTSFYGGINYYGSFGR